MNHASHNRLISFIGSIADDCLRDVDVRGKYRDVILPMVVLRRPDTLLEPTKEEILRHYPALSVEKDQPNPNSSKNSLLGAFGSCWSVFLSTSLNAGVRGE